MPGMMKERLQSGLRPVLLLIAAAAGLLVAVAEPAPPAAATPAPATSAPASPAPPPPPAATMAEVLTAAPASAWRPLDERHTLYLELPAGRVVIELEPAMAPRTVANIEALVRLKYFDGLAMLRVQDNFVAQWGDPEERHRIPEGMQKLPPEFTVPLGTNVFTSLPDRDGYAPQVGFVDSFPAARDPASGLAWLAHCYAAVGVGRDTDPASGIGTELYAVIGHAPRQLDRNVTVVGRVRQGIELLASLPRGSAEMGFYDKAAQRTPIASVRLASEIPASERTRLEVLRTDSAAFTALVEARRNRRDTWYQTTAGYIDLCNVPLPVRTPHD